MTKPQESHDSRRIQEVADRLGLSPETVEGLAPIEIDLPGAAAEPARAAAGPAGAAAGPAAPEPEREPQVAFEGSAGDALVAELRGRIAALERRLDDAETERRDLLRAFAAERQGLVQLLLERRSAGAWPGVWPALRRLFGRRTSGY